MTTQHAPVAYFWGQDAYALERGAAALAVELGGTEAPLEIWRVDAEEDDTGAETVASASGSAVSRRRTRLIDDVLQRVSVAPLFGGGTLAVVRQPTALLREATARDRLVALVGQVPAGNGLCITDLVAPGASGPAAGGILRDAVAAAGGLVREFPALTRERMESWIVTRAAELGVRLAPGAARLLAERIGAYVREGDIDRRRHAQLANGELEKLALLRPDGSVTRDDVDALVPEAVPGSMWAFLDAVAARRTADAGTLAARLLAEGMPLPVLVSQLHRRVRDLLVVREHLSAGTRPGDLVRVMRLQPFRAQKLAEQADRWTMTGLEHALGGLVQLDLLSKGVRPDGSASGISEARSALGLEAWVAEHVPPSP